MSIAANDAPVADAGGPYSARFDVEILFDASASLDPDGSISGYRWDWTNDGGWDTGVMHSDMGGPKSAEMQAAVLEASAAARADG